MYHGGELMALFMSCLTTITQILVRGRRSDFQLHNTTRSITTFDIFSGEPLYSLCDVMSFSVAVTAEPTSNVLMRVGASRGI